MAALKDTPPLLEPRDKETGKTPLFPAFFFLCFLCASGIMAFLYLGRSLAGVETPDYHSFLQGAWPPKFEKSLGEQIPVNTPSRTLWGKIEYALFHQGRKGVVVGANGWLFTDEEFSCPTKTPENLTGNFSYIESVAKQFAAKNVKLAVVLVPAKTRVFSDYLLESQIVPACRVGVYALARARLSMMGVVSTDLLSAMQAAPAPETLYLKTDTHWSPDGAKLAALETGKLLLPFDRDVPSMRFLSTSGAERTYEGDLLRYTPGAPIAPDRLTENVTEAKGEGHAADLLGDPAGAMPKIVLVGTSYSAKPEWNFLGFLKESLQTDILDMSDEGLGPMVVMDKYLASDAFKNTPPRALIWEIPERFLLMPHGVSASP